MYELATDHYSPLSIATYDPTTGELYLEFDYDRLLDINGEWRDGRHIDAVTFMGQAYPIIIHADDGPRDENGRYIFDRDTVDNIFTINVGTGHDPADGTLDFGLSDREDGTRELYTFDLVESEPTPNEAPVTVRDDVIVSADDSILLDVLANDSDPEGGPLTLTFAITEGAADIDVTVEDNQLRLDPIEGGNVDIIHTITYTVEDAQGASSQGLAVVTIDGVDPVVDEVPTLVQAVNAGGGEYVAANGVTYEADTFANGRTFSTAAGIEGTDDDTLYQTEKWSKTLEYELAVENGAYDIELNFAEIWGGAKDAGKRVIDLYVEDELVFEDLDLAEDAGFRAALDIVGEVTVTDGTLNIRAEGDVQNAKLAGFSVWESEGQLGDAFAVGSLYDDLSFA
ncbi:MAG: malectin domain-containing carbohydrate-binding protein [Pseudomonadota bacterium]